MKMKNLWSHENRDLIRIGIVLLFAGLVGMKQYWEKLSEFLFWELHVKDSGVDYGFKSAYYDYFQLIDCMFVCFLILIVIIGFQLFYQQNQTEQREWLSSLPVSKEKMLFGKIGKGIAAYTIPWFVFSVGMVTINNRNYGAIYECYIKDSQWKMLLSKAHLDQIWKYLLYVWVILTACYMVVIFWQVVCKNSVAASVFAVGTCLVPTYTNWLTDMYLAYDKAGQQSIVGILHKLTGYGIFTGVSQEVFGNIYGMSVINMPGIVMVFALAAIVVCLGLCGYYGKHEKESTGDLFAARWIRWVLLCGIVICGATCMHAMLLHTIYGKMFYLLMIGIVCGIAAVNRVWKKGGY